MLGCAEEVVIELLFSGIVVPFDVINDPLLALLIVVIGPSVPLPCIVEVTNPPE